MCVFNVANGLHIEITRATIIYESLKLFLPYYSPNLYKNYIGFTY